MHTFFILACDVMKTFFSMNDFFSVMEGGQLSDFFPQFSVFDCGIRLPF